MTKTLVSTRAIIAVAKSKIAAILDDLHFDAHDVVIVGLALAIGHSRKASIDSWGLHALLDDALVAEATEGGRGLGGGE